MIDFMGWGFIAVAGSWAIFVFTFLMMSSFKQGGLETIEPCLLVAFIAGFMWLVGVFYFSPLTITFTGAV